MQFHTPVLVQEILLYLQPQPGQTAVDCTLGGGGHALELAFKISPGGKLVGIDLDRAAVDQAEKVFDAARVKSKTFFVRDNYKHIDSILDDLKIEGADLILADIGISSFDLEASNRGFTFQKDQPLDMRFDAESRPERKNAEPLTADYILQHYSEQQLEEVFREYGEEKFSRKIARGIVQVRQQHRLSGTLELFELIKKSLPAALRFKAGDSARRIFQALRIEVNHELDNLQEFLPKAFKVLKPGGRLAVISFHSLEDRIVKQFFLEKAKGCICPPDFPQCVCGRNPEGKILTKKPVTASAEEIEKNPRAKPAKLRVIQKI